MKRIAVCLMIFAGFAVEVRSQDTLGDPLTRNLQLSEVVVRSGLSIPEFIVQVKSDTSFYKAFRNLRVLGFTALNDIRMTDKKGKLKASLQSRTRQLVKNGCRSMLTLEEQTSGDMYDSDHNFNYYTAQLYASLFFTKEPVCGETNIVKGVELKAGGKSGLAKHKEQLKMLFFNPGKKIPGIPFIGDRIAIFEEPAMNLYDFAVDMGEHLGQRCYIFTVKTRSNLSGAEKDDVVINSMTTWFDYKTLEIVAREYDLSYNAGVYDFSVQMEVRMTHFGELLVPALIRYNGNWDVLLKKRERGIFTATLFDFER